MWLRGRYVAVLAMVVAALGGWAAAGDAQAPATKAQWVVAIGEEGESLDPPTSMLFTSEIYQQHLFDTLVGHRGRGSQARGAARRTVGDGQSHDVALLPAEGRQVPRR